MQLTLNYTPGYTPVFLGVLDFFIDLFCGAGGTSTGIENSKIAKVVYCINHDKNAILSHSKNHKEAIHTVEDIRIAALQPIVDLVEYLRKTYRGCRIHLWASLECTNHSNAKGGMSRDADSRTLADHLFRYIEAICPDMIWIENVREFKDWCRLRIKAKSHKKFSELVFEKRTKKNKDRKLGYVMVPDKRFKAEDYDRWTNLVKSYGYNYDMQILDAADYGCETSRRRLFIQFAKSHIKISWPEATHAKGGKNGLLPWKAVRPLLKLYEPGGSIFGKKLKEPSLFRILRGLKKFGVNPFFTKYYGNGANVASLEDSCPALTTKDRMYLTQSELADSSYMLSEYGSDHSTSLAGPSPALAANPKQRLVTATHFLMDYAYKNVGNSIEGPCPTLIARQDKKPKYLVSGEVSKKPRRRLIGNQKINKTDSPATKEIKKFMQENGIVDIKMRSLFVDEMLAIMGFPTKIGGFEEDYELAGTMTEQKKYIGNSVPCYLVEQLISHSVTVNQSGHLKAA